jgi:outer membrane protein assembly factor BamA
MIKLAKYSFVFILLVFCTSIILAQNSIQIFSRFDYSHDYLEEISKNSVDSLQSTIIISDQILDSYSKGYITAGYDSIVMDSTSLRAYLTYGPQYYWKQLNYIGFENQERELKSIRKKAYVDYSKLQKLFLEILNYEAQRGYPFAQINFSSLEISEDSLITASLDIDKGEYFSFDSIIIKGEPKIKHHYLEKYLEIKKGEKFSIQKVNDIDNKLKNLRFIEQSRPYQLAFSDDKAFLLLYLKDKKANSFNGMIGILPNNKTTGKLLVTGDVNLLLMNSVGIGELFEFRWQKFDPLSQKLNAKLAIPYLFKTQFGVGTKFNIEKIDSSYLNTDFTGKILFGSNSGSGFEIFYRKAGSYILREVTETELSNLSDFSTNLFGVSYRYINADNVINPKKGILFELSSGFGT